MFRAKRMSLIGKATLATLACVLAAALALPFISFTNTRVSANSGDPLEAPLFRFVQITDTNITDASSAQVIALAAADIAKLPSAPTFVIHTGDIVDYPSDTGFDNYTSQITKFSCTVYSAIGDNDDSSANGKTLFEQKIGQRNYAFDVAPYHFIVLDSTMPGSILTNGGGFEAETLTWLQTHLNTLSRTQPIVVFTHHAFWSPFAYDPGKNLFCDVENPDDVMNLFANYNLVGVFSGHALQNMQYTDPSTGTTFHISGALRLTTSGYVNQDQSAPGYTIAECYSDRINTYYVPLGQISQYYIYPRTNVRTVAQDGTGNYNGTTEKPIQDAIDDLHALGGGTVIIKSGTYILTGTDTSAYYRCILMYDNIWLVGQGNPVLKFCDGSRNKRAISCVDNIANIEIRNLTIDCNVANALAGADHTWYNGIEMDGTWEDVPPSHQPTESEMVRDVLIEGCTIINCDSRGIVSYAGRRWTVRDCHFNKVDGPISPDHWTDYWMIEDNVIENGGDTAIELNDTSYSVILTNTINNFSNIGINIWQYFTSCGLQGNSILYNNISNITGSHAIQVNVDPGSLEYLGNTITNANIGVYLNSNEDWVFGGNTYTNVTTREWYTGYSNHPLSPAGLEIVSSTSNSVTVRVITQASATGTQFWFEAREYIAQGNYTSFSSSGWTSGDTYTFTGLSGSRDCAFRVRASTGAITPWAEWYVHFTT